MTVFHFYRGKKNSERSLNKRHMICKEDFVYHCTPVMDAHPLTKFGTVSRGDKSLSHRWAKNSSRKHTKEQSNPASINEYKLGTPITQLTDE